MQFHQIQLFGNSLNKFLFKKSQQNMYIKNPDTTQLCLKGKITEIDSPQE